MLCSQRVSHVTLVMCLVIGNWRGPKNRKGGGANAGWVDEEKGYSCVREIFIQKIGQSVDDGLNLWEGDHNS